MDKIYSILLNYGFKLIALFIFATSSYASIPTDIYRWIELVLSAGFILYCGYIFNKEKRYFPTMFTWSLGLLPFAFFLEMRMLYGSFSIDMVKYADKYSHSMVVYNSFRYVLIIFVFIILVKDLFKAIKNCNE